MQGVINNAIIVGGVVAVGLGIGEAIVWNAVSTNSNDIQTNTNTISTNTASVNALCGADTTISNLATVATVMAAPTLPQLQTLATAVNNIITAAATAGC